MKGQRMNKRKGTEKLKRIIALFLAVVMLPFADYGQVLAYSGQNHAPVPDGEEALISGNTIIEQNSGETDREEIEIDGTEAEEIEADSFTAERAGGENAADREPWERISFQEAERIKLTDPSDYKDMTIEAEAFVMEEDIEVGNLYVNGESLDLNGHSLTVYGTLLQTAGEVRLNGGQLLVGGDYRIQTREEKENPEPGEELYFYKESNGQLVMTEETDYLFLCGSFFMDSTISSEGNLTAGTMELMGDFTQLSSISRMNFIATDAHKTIFSGKEEQNIAFQNSGLQESRFANLEIGILEDAEEGNGAKAEDTEEAAGLSIQGCPYVSGEVIDTKSRQVSGKIGISGTTSFVDGYFGGGIYTLQPIQIKPNEKIRLGGDVEIVQAVSIYGILEAKGNTVITSGIVSMEGGKLLVGQNLTVSNSYNSGIKMYHEDDYVSVGGNFTYHPIWEQEMSAGVLEIKGNAAINRCFHATGTHKTILSGDSKQTVIMADGMYFHVLELKNQSQEGVYSEKALQKSQLIRNGCKLTYGEMEGSYGYTLEKDEVIEGDFILIDDTLDLNGHSLKIKGDLIQAAGAIVINGGLLTVDGDYRQQSIKGTEENQEGGYGVSTGFLQMMQEDDHVLINGNMYVETIADTTGKLTNGVLELKGDFLQKRTSGLNNFKATENHILLLSGTDKQVVSMEYSTVGGSQLQNLEIQNKSIQGTILENRPYIAGLVADSRNQVSGQIAIGSTTQFEEGYFGGSVCTLQEITIKGGEELEIGGDMEVNETANIYGSLWVRGNIEVGRNANWSLIAMEGGSLRVGKDFIAGKGNKVTYGIRMSHEADHVLVEGDFLYQPYYDTGLSAGTLELKGNADIRSNFHATGIHRTLLSGDKKQTITMADGLYFNILELQNYSEDGVYSEKALQKSQLIRNGCKLTYGDTAGIYGFTLREDYTAEGDFILLEDTMDLNGHTLTIRGDLIQAGGEILVNGGTLIVEGDYRQQTRRMKNESLLYEAGSGLLTMEKDTDRVQIAGSFITQTTASMQGHLQKGVLQIKGDLKQLGSNGFLAGEDHTLCLNGEDTQKLTMQADSAFGSLTIENTSRMGVVLNSDANLSGTVTDADSKLSGSGNLIISSTSQLAEGNCGGNIRLTGEETLEKDITIKGCLTIDGTLKLDIHKLHADACVVNGMVSIENGTLLLSSYLNVNDGGHFVMTEAGGYVLVNGNLNFASSHSHNGLLTKGTLEVRGDVMQKAAANFIATDSHTTVLSKKLTTTGRTKIQTISFTHPGTARFHRLVLRKNLKTGYIFHDLPETIADEVVYEVTDETPPSAVSGISIGNVTPTSVTITYQEATDDTGVIGYEIHRNGRKAAVTGALSYTDTGLTPDTAYTYTVYAFDADRNLSQQSAEVEIVTLADEEAPEQVKGLSIVSSTGSAITLSWKPALDNVKTEYYSLYRNEELVAANIEATTYKDTGLKENTLYIYTITASDKAGNVSEKSQEVHGAVTMPKITSVFPKDYETIGGDNVTLTARFSSAGNSKGNQVVIEYFDEKKEIWQPITPTPLGQKVYDSRQYYVSYLWDISRFQEDKDMDVRFVLTDQDGNRREMLVTYSLDKTPPKAPENLEVKESNGVLTLTWDRSRSADLAGTILRRQKEDGNFEILADLTDASLEWYTDKEVETGTAYTYTLQAYDKFGQKGPLSMAVTGIPSRDDTAPVIQEMLPVSQAVADEVAIQVEAKDNRSVDTISLYGKYQQEEEWNLLVEQKAKDNRISYRLDTSGYEEGSYQVKALAKDTAGNESENPCIRTYTIDHTGIAKIRLKDHTIGSTSAQITWEDVTEEDFGWFRVEELKDGAFVTVEDVTERLGYTLTGLKPETAHTVRVVGYDYLGNRGEESDELTFTTQADTSGPEILAVFPVSSYYKDSIPLQLKAKDNDQLHRAVISYSLDGETYEVITELFAEENKKEYTFSHDWNISALPEGKVTVKFEAYDKAGNHNLLTEENLDIINTYTIDRTPPEQVKNIKAEGGEGCAKLTWDLNTEEDLKGYKIYRAEEESGVSTVLCPLSATKNYVDSQVEEGRTYIYRVAAVDIAGNEGESSKEAAATIKRDETAPEVTGISPDTDTLLGEEASLEVIATDNSQLASITLEYREKDANDIWHTIETESAKGRLEYKKVSWNGKGLLEDAVYEVRASAVDKNGNVSEYVTADYKFDLTAPGKPELKAESGSFLIRLSYTENTEEDFEKYCIYRKALGEKDFVCIQTLKQPEYEDTQVETNQIYYYKVRAYDSRGNYSESQVVNSYANEVDTIAPIASLPENIVAINGMQTMFDGTGSTDNVRVVKYLWDMGDGTKKTGSKIKHTYKEPGTYQVLLTVKDAAGNENSTTCTVLVKNRDKNGITSLTVQDSSGVGIPYAYVYVKTGEEEQLHLRTDGLGRVDICTLTGVYEYCAFAEGYLPKDSTIYISNQEKKEETITLPSGEVVVGEMNVRRMELEEMVEAGVDFSKPENYHTYVFSVVLTFAATPIPILVEDKGLAGGSGNALNLWDESSGGDYHKLKRKINVNGKFIIPECEEEAGDVLPIFLCFSAVQSVTWLKEMYNVELAVFNNANPRFPIENASAALELPEGVSLAQLKSEQNLIKHMERIEGGQAGTASWVVKGDEPGEYNLEASFHGTLSPFQAPVDARFQGKYGFEVEGGKGIHIIVMPQDARYTGEKYYIQYKIINESGRNFYNLSTTIGEYQTQGHVEEIIVKDRATNAVLSVNRSGGKTYYTPNTNKCKVLPVTYGGDTIKVGVLEPGEEIYGTYMPADTAGRKGYSYYFRLVDEFVKSLEGSNLGVHVTVEPIGSHISKYIVYVGQKAYADDMDIYGDPVDVTTGAFLQTIDGLSMAEDGTIPFSIEYNSMLAEKAGEAGNGMSHNYEQWIENNGNTLTYHSSPYAHVDFISQEALKNTTYGRLVNGDVMLDEEKEYTGTFLSMSTAMEEYKLMRNEDKSYTLTSPIGEALCFDKEGKLVQIKKDEKRILDIARGEGTLTVTDRLTGKSVFLAYNEQGLISQVRDAAGRTEQLAYDGSGNLISITNPAGVESRYHYDDSHHLTEAVNENGVLYLKNTYDEEGRVTSQWQPDSGKTSTLTYEDNEYDGTDITITDHRGGTQTVTTNEKGQKIAWTDQNGNRSTYLYDYKGNLLTETGADGNSSMYRYDENGNMTHFIDCLGNTTQMTYDGNGDLRSIDGAKGDKAAYTYDACHNLIQSVDYKGMVTSYKYNEKNQLTEETVEGLGTRKYTYEDGNMSSYTDYKGNKTRLSYDDMGNIIESTDPMGNTTRYVYDRLGRRQMAELPSGVILTYGYDDCGNLTEETETDGTGSKKPRTTTYQYDRMGRKTSETAPDNTVTEYEYDGEGNLTEIRYPDGTKEKNTYDGVGNLTRHEDRTGIATTYRYDRGNRMVWEETEGRSTRYEYYPNGKLKKETLDDGQTMEYTYDSNWNLVQTTRNGKHTTTYRVDVAGNILEERDALGNTTTYTYDLFGRMTAETDPRGNTTHYAYDANGNCTGKTNALGTTTTMEYDRMDRLSSVTVHTKEKGDITVSYEYNAEGQATAITNEDGKTSHITYDVYGDVEQVTDYYEKTTTRNAYDTMGRLTDTWDGTGARTSYGYDGAGRIETITETTGAGEAVQTKYWYEKGRLTAVTDKAGKESRYAYDRTGNIKAVTDPNGWTTSYSRDNMGRVTQVTNALNEKAAAYTYNAEGLLE
ncbi:MAG: PKD domain-containing protein, partial [Lachnospiraceae bacterium]|nr:PKD domain-containing protein [Lachnospiraceae bacterium]